MRRPAHAVRGLTVLVGCATLSCGGREATVDTQGANTGAVGGSGGGDGTGSGHMRSDAGPSDNAGGDASDMAGRAADDPVCQTAPLIGCNPRGYCATSG
jgi:hypothetical protein